MINLKTETLVSFDKATTYFTERPNVFTLHRWRLWGVIGVKLESTCLDGQHFTSIEAVGRFCNATGALGTQVAETGEQRLKLSEKAEQEMHKALMYFSLDATVATLTTQISVLDRLHESMAKAEEDCRAALERVFALWKAGAGGDAPRVVPAAMTNDSLVVHSSGLPRT